MSRRRKVAPKRYERAAAKPRSAAPIGLALVLLLTVLVYSPSINGTRLWDDDAHITRPDLQSWQGLYQIWSEVTATQQYYPLLHTTFWLEHKLWGDSVLGYHLINLLWHIVAVSLVYAILTRLKIPGALLAAAIFAVHPVMVESVAWISEQKNTLSAVFYLSAMLVYLDFDQSRQPSRYFLAIALFVLGLLTKTVTATLPAALLVIFWWQRGTLSWKRDIVPLLPFFLLGAAAGVVTAVIERKLIGAEGAEFEMTILERGLLAGRVIWFYLSKLAWPANLIFVYPRWHIDPKIWWQWLFPAAALGVSFGLWVIRNKVRGPLAGWLLFVGTLAPVLGFLNVYPFIFSFVADHFQYLASLGAIVLVAAGIAQGIERLSRPARYLGIALCVVLISTLAALSFRQSRTYADVRTLYETTLDRNPSCWMAYNNLGDLFKESDPGEVIALYRKALALRPDYPQAHNNLGYVFIQLGRFPEAIEHLQESIKTAPDFPQAHNNLGRAFYYTHRIPEATEQFQIAIGLNPRDANAHNNLANLFSAAGKMDDAIEHYQEAVQIRPSFVAAQYRLAEVLRQRGLLQQAIDHYQAALQYDPVFIDIYLDLAAALAEVKQSNEAIATAQKGIAAARPSGQEAAAQQLEEWLKHYQTELQRNDASAVFQPSTPAQTHTHSQ
jgi:tetratricopeptide (TPR) repeat protein